MIFLRLGAFRKIPGYLVTAAMGGLALIAWMVVPTPVHGDGPTTISGQVVNGTAGCHRQRTLM